MEGHWAFCGPGEKEKWYPVFKGTSASNRGVMRKKNNKDTIHCNGESSKLELLYRIIHSANQLCPRGSHKFV